VPLHNKVAHQTQKKVTEQSTYMSGHDINTDSGLLFGEVLIRDCYPALLIIVDHSKIIGCMAASWHGFFANAIIPQHERLHGINRYNKVATRDKQVQRGGDKGATGASSHAVVPGASQRGDIWPGMPICVCKCCLLPNNIAVLIPCSVLML